MAHIALKAGNVFPFALICRKRGGHQPRLHVSREFLSKNAAPHTYRRYLAYLSATYAHSYESNPPYVAVLPAPFRPIAKVRCRPLLHRLMGPSAYQGGQKND